MFKKPPVRVLEHHAVAIEKQFNSYPFCLPGHEEEEVRELNLPNMKHATLPDGTPLYPRLNCEQYVRAKTLAVKAILDGEADIIPDTDVDGRDNFDIICASCGNIERGNDGKFRCGLKQRKKLFR